MKPFDAKMRAAFVLVGAAILILVGIFVALNLTGGEKKIERRLERLYSLDDPQFRRDLGVLLGPPFVEGNRHRTLLNGDEIGRAS